MQHLCYFSYVFVFNIICVLLNLYVIYTPLFCSCALCLKVWPHLSTFEQRAAFSGLFRGDEYHQHVQAVPRRGWRGTRCESAAAASHLVAAFAFWIYSCKHVSSFIAIWFFCFYVFFCSAYFDFLSVFWLIFFLFFVAKFTLPLWRRYCGICGCKAVSRTRTRTRIHMHMRMHIYTYTHSHSHSHLRMRSPPQFFSFCPCR